MTKEIYDIIAAYQRARLDGRKAALATVVHVEGSSYRRPGARMLVEDNGKLTGAISGGCLEGDALKKALLAIEQQRNKLVTYNTNHEDDAEFGIQLGCNGIVHILFEPIDESKTNNPIAILERCSSQRRDAVLATMFSLYNYYGLQPGTCLLYDGESLIGNVEDENVRMELHQQATSVLASKTSLLKQLEAGELTAFVEYVQPAVSLLIVGAGNDALPLVEMTTALGWQITIVDGRATHASKQRFAKVHQVIVAKPAEAIKQLVIDERSAIVLMTHNYNYDLEMLSLLLHQKCKYIGILGPKKKLERMLAALEDQGIFVSADQRAKLYGPTGLDIGAETAEEIALSVLAEINTVLSHRNAGFLRNRPEEIHSRSQASINEERTQV